MQQGFPPKNLFFIKLEKIASAISDYNRKYRHKNFKQSDVFFRRATPACCISKIYMKNTIFFERPVHLLSVLVEDPEGLDKVGHRVKILSRLQLK